MEFTKIQIWTGGGLTALLVSMAALAQSGCSSDNSSTATDGGSDSSVVDAVADVVGPPPPLGVPLSTCSVLNCAVCGGVLGSPDSGITFCTQDCEAGTDCPTGLACVANQSSSFLNNLCLRTCTSNSDCTAPFICRSDLSTPGSYCYTPYPPQGPPTPFDSGTPTTDAGSGTPDAAPDTGTPTPEAGPPDAAPTSDAGPDAADGG